MSERADVEGAQRRDAASFRRLYDVTADRIHALARWLLSTRDVDDVVQEVYVRVWEELPALRDPGAFGSWLQRVAVSVILRWRERSDRFVRQEGAVIREASEIARESPSGLRLDLERAIGMLPAGARDVFVLYDVQGHDHREIAQLLGISHHTSRSQLHRARTLLKHFLREGNR